MEIFAGDEPPVFATAEAFTVLRLGASVVIGEMTVESEVPTDILIVDIEMTKRTGITHDTVEGIDGHLGKRRKLSLGGKYEKTRPCGTIVCATT